MTRLPMACYEGRVDEVRRLLDGGADIHQQDTVGRSPLFVACQYGRDAVVRLLLDHERSTSRSALYGATGLFCATNLPDEPWLAAKRSIRSRQPGDAPDRND